MARLTRRLAVGAAAAGVVVLAVGCTASGVSAPGTQPSSASSRALPVPFMITAHYSAKSLGLDHPDALAIGPDGNLYVTDLSQRVSMISPSGTVLRRWGKPGRGPGEFQFIAFDPTTPTDIHGKIAIGVDGMVYVADSGNRRVQVFTPQGRFIRQFGSFGSGPGQFFNASDLVVDKTGNVYVADEQALNVAKFSPAGKIIWQIGSASSDPDLIGHHHLAGIDPHGRIVMVNDDLQKVLYVDPGGHVVDAFSPRYPAGHACEATVDGTGDTYVSGCGPHPGAPTLVFGRSHRLIAEWPGSTYRLLRSPAFGPRGEVFALASDGSILKLGITLSGA